MDSSFNVNDVSEYTSLQSNFDGERSFEEMFGSVWDLEEKLQKFPSTLVPSTKSEEKANKLRLLGDRSYRDRKVEMALTLYNMSLMVSPHPQLNSDSQSRDNQRGKDVASNPSCTDLANYGGTPGGTCRPLADAFASRAIVLFDLELYEKALRDINLALKYECSEELRTKIVSMKDKCNALARSSREEAVDVETEINKENKNPELSSSIESPNNSNITTFKSLLGITLKRPPTLKEPSLSAPALSSAVKVAMIPSSGRGLIAQRNIYPGEVLLVDRAYSVGLGVEELSSYCSTCLCLCLTPLPCPGCSEVVYCSELCRQDGLSNEHWIECKILPSMIDLGISSTYYPHKMLKNFTYNHIVNILKTLNDAEGENSQHLSGFNAEGVYNSSSYQAVHHLCTNKEKSSPEFLIKQCKYAYVFTKLLHMSGRFFVSSDGKTLENLAREDFVTTGAVLLSHILMIHNNQFRISDQKNASKRIGSGLFLTASLVNHSCYQSTTRFTCGRDLVLMARRPIQAGEEVTGTYTTDFSQKSLSMRRAILANYQVDCKCFACEYQWPTYDHLPKFRCIECRETGTESVDVCLSCRSKVIQSSSGELSEISEIILPCKEEMWRDTRQKIEQALKKVMAVENKVKNGEIVSEGDCKAVCQCIEIAHRYIGIPCQFICTLENTLLSCMYAL